MSRIESYTEETDWTKDDLRKLLTAVKGGISEQDRMDIYTKGMETIDWRKVAFPPFPPEACQEKMIAILEQMRKTRTLTELIVEAEDSICSPVQNETGECEEQRQPPADEDNRSLLNLRKRKSGTGDAQEQRNECEDDDEEGRPAKPPWNGYILFCKEKMASRAKGSKTPQWSQLWRDLTKMERQEYNSRSKELRSRYSVQLNRYLLSSDPEAQRLLNNHGTEKSRGANREKTFPDEPKMPAAAANSAFMKEQMKLLKDKVPDTKRRFSCCCSRWKNLPAEEKERYRESADEDLRRFWKELQSWFETLRPAEQKLYLALNPGKMKYLDVQKAPVWKKKEIPCRPSDSEDEDIEDSSSDEEEDGSSCEEEGEAADEDVVFEMYRW